MPKNFAFFIAVSVVAMTLLAGCGGGGGNGSSPTPITLTGTVLDYSGNGLVGIKVAEAKGTASTTTTAGGAFSLEIPASQTQSVEYIDFYDSTGIILVDDQVTVTVTSGQTQSLGTISEGPPAPPITSGAVTK
jgi:hypothetical protein